MFREAFKLYADGHEDQALSRYIYLSALGFEIANFNAGFILEKSKDPKHLQRAAFFYSRSGKMDNSEATRKVGDVFYRLGDPISAVAHYILASKLSSPDPEALFNIGYAYETGIGLRKDLWSALDMYTSSLAHGKSGKIAVTLALSKVRGKIFLDSLFNAKSRNNARHQKSKTRKNDDKLVTMIGTLLITSLIYFYMNYFLPRQQQRQVLEGRTRTNQSESPESTPAPLSVHSDSSSEAEFTGFQFRKPEENNESDDVD